MPAAPKKRSPALGELLVAAYDVVIFLPLWVENRFARGAETAPVVTADAGASWHRVPGLPTVAVHELAQHPECGEMVAATHGRGVWELVLEQIDKVGYWSLEVWGGATFDVAYRFLQECLG